ncbi:hypothetical protein BC628DRAFT_418450 [Trametes gibbosa]|nr:hypothetical protein BC628DRAFT_418450 [Trametes gibbosa]
MVSQKPGANTNIDAVFLPVSSVTTARPTFDEVAVTCEHEVQLRDQIENWKQLVSGVVYTMNLDPKRKHMFSFSIEDTTMTAWFFSRSHACMSESFDMCAPALHPGSPCLHVCVGGRARIRHDYLPHPGRFSVVLRLPSRRSLLQDDTLHFEHNGTRITGRGARVREVVRVRDLTDLKPLEKTHYARKDVWLDENALTEGAIQDALFRDLDAVSKRIQDTDAATLEIVGRLKDHETVLDCIAVCKLYGQYFMTLHHDWKGPTSKPLAHDAVPAPDIFEASKPERRPADDIYADPVKCLSFGCHADRIGASGPSSIFAQVSISCCFRGGRPGPSQCQEYLRRIVRCGMLRLR